MELVMDIYCSDEFVIRYTIEELIEDRLIDSVNDIYDTVRLKEIAQIEVYDNSLAKYKDESQAIPKAIEDMKKATYEIHQVSNHI